MKQERVQSHKSNNTIGKSSSAIKNSKIQTFKSQSNLNSVNLSYYKNLNQNNKLSNNDAHKNSLNSKSYLRAAQDKSLTQKISRYNSADKYKLQSEKNSSLKNKINKFDEIIRKTNNKSKKEKDTSNCNPPQINININNYNFSNYNCKSSHSKFRSSQQGETIVSNVNTRSVIKNNSNSPAYIEIINPFTYKQESEKDLNSHLNIAVCPSDSNFQSIQHTNMNKPRNISTREGYNMINTNRLQNKLISSNLSKLNQLILGGDSQIASMNSPPIDAFSPILNSQGYSKPVGDSKKIIINKNVQKKVKEINSGSSKIPSIEDSLPDIGSNEIVKVINNSLI